MWILGASRVKVPLFLLGMRFQLRWLDWIFLRGYLPSLSINYVATSKDMAKRLPQLYYIKMKISYDLGFNAIGVAIATQRRHYVFYLSLCFSVPRVF